MEENRTTPDLNRPIELVTIGTEFGKLVFESGKRELKEWTEEMLLLDEAFRPLLKEIHSLLLSAERAGGQGEGPSDTDHAPSATDDHSEAAHGQEGTSTDHTDEPLTIDGETTIKALLDSVQINLRAYNVCFRADLKTLNDIRCYYDAHRTFKGLKNCGSNTDYLLRRFVEESIPVRPVQSDQVRHLNPDRLRAVFHKHFKTLPPETKDYLLRVVPDMNAVRIYTHLVGFGRSIPIKEVGGRTISTDLRDLRRKLIATHMPNSGSGRAARIRQPRVAQRPEPHDDGQLDLKGMEGRLLEVLKEHSIPLHVESVARKLGLAHPGTDELWSYINGGGVEMVRPLGHGFMGLAWRVDKALPPTPKPLKDSLYRKAIWEYFTGWPIKELHTYLLACTELSGPDLITAIYRKMHEKGYYLDTRACLRTGPQSD